MNKYFIIGSIFSIIAVTGSLAYLFGRVQTLSQLSTDTQNQVLPTQTEQTDIPTTKPQVIYKPSIPNPTQVPERKVPVTVTEVGVAGTYYCYEDNSNTIAQKQTELNNLHKLFDFCAIDLQYKTKSCFDVCNQNTTTCIKNCLTSSDQNSCNNNCISQGNACTDKCPKGTECNNKSNDVMKAQDELGSIIRRYCP